MYLVQIGQDLRRRRLAAGLTQAQLAQLGGVARETVARLENGTDNDVGVKKLVALLAAVGAQLCVADRERTGTPDYVARATQSANIRLQGHLYGDELIAALLTGKSPPGKTPHLQTALEEISEDNLAGLIDQVGTFTARPERIAAGVKRLQT